MERIKTDTFPFFGLGDVSRVGAGIAIQIAEAITGRLANTSINMGILAQMIFYAGDGDHLEIGTLFGGSAILAARIKQLYDLQGKVICVDPLTSWYGQPIDPKSGVRVSVDVVEENAEEFGVLDRIEIVSEESNPWPFDLDERFKSAYIDGNHAYSGCLSDWENCRRQVTDFVMFDNFDRVHMGVVNVVCEAMCSPIWTPIHINDVSVVLTRDSKIKQWMDAERHSAEDEQEDE